MGAVPRWMTLALTLADADEVWLEGFARGLFDAAASAGVALVGGDTTRGEQLVVSVQVLGDVEADKSLRRSGARAGDAVFISGRPGDAAAGLELLQADAAAKGALTEQFRRPQPRLRLGAALGGLATACIDVSDGFAGDLRKLLTASGVGAEVKLESVPIGPALAAYAEERALDFALQGGDDYELCFTAPASAVDAVLAAAARSDTLVTRIGAVTANPELVFTRHGEHVDVATTGYNHFGCEQ